MSERLEGFRKELEGTIYTNRDEIDVYLQLRSGGMAEVGAIEALNSFGIEELKAIERFRRLYSHYFPNIQAERFDKLADAFLVSEKWRFKQSERVKELEASRKEIAASFGSERKQNKRYREAIERAVRHLKNLKIEDGANFAYLTLIKALEADEQ